MTSDNFPRISPGVVLLPDGNLTNDDPDNPVLAAYAAAERERPAQPHPSGLNRKQRRARAKRRRV